MTKMILGIVGLVAVASALVACDENPPQDNISIEDREFIEQHGVSDEDLRNAEGEGGDDGFNDEETTTIAAAAS